MTINLNSLIQKELINEYAGSEKKRTIVINGEKYLLKMPDPVREKNRMLSYINNSYSEYVGCKIFKMLGMPVQEVIIGSYYDGKKDKIACACKDIRKPNETLLNADLVIKGLFPDVPDIDFNVGFELLSQVADLLPLDNGEYLFTKNDLIDFYSKQFIIDALIGNEDRHNGNWGFIRNDMNLNVPTYRIAPVFDCGSCLSPLYSDEELTASNLSNDINNTQSALRDVKGRKIHYRDYIISTVNQDVNRALKDIIKRIDISTIAAFINDIDCISEQRKDYYIGLIVGRYEAILIPTLEKLSQVDVTFKDNACQHKTEQEKTDILYRFIKPIRQTKPGSCGNFKMDNTKYEYRRVKGQKILVYNEETSFVLPIKNDYKSVEDIIARCAKESQNLGFKLTLENQPNKTVSDSSSIEEVDIEDECGPEL